MGKARILSAKGEGLYDIELIEDRARATTARALAVGRIDQIDTLLAELEIELSEAQAAVDQAAAAQDQAIVDYQAALTDGEIDTAEARKAMVEAGTALTEAAATRDGVQRRIARLKAERMSLESRIALIDALPPLRQLEAWCADYTEDLAGEVATAEVPGEVGQVLVRPGDQDGAAWSAADDGAMQPALSGTAASVFYNLAMLPGWQKWRPTYRIGVITSLDQQADTCGLDLVPATSSQQDLALNAQASYAGVPIQYMTCDAAVFEVGDRVLVAFAGDPDSPMVIGFESEPRQCGGFGLLDVERSLLALYPDPMVSGVVITQPDQTNYYKETAEAGDYLCEASGSTFTRVDVTEVRTETAVIPDKDYVIYDIERWIPSDITPANSTAELVVINEIVSCAGVAVQMDHLATWDRSFTSSGWYGYRTENNITTHDGDCAAGVADDVTDIISFDYQRVMAGTIQDAALDVSWERRSTLAQDLDQSFSQSVIDRGLPSLAMGFAEQPNDGNPRVMPSPADSSIVTDVLEFGGVVVDLLAIDVARRGGLVYWIPEVALYRGEEGIHGAVVLHEGASRESGIILRVIGFKREDDQWQRNDVPNFMLSHIRDATQRRQTINNLTDRNYSVFDLTLDAIPATVG